MHRVFYSVPDRILGVLNSLSCIGRNSIVLGEIHFLWSSDLVT